MSARPRPVTATVRPPLTSTPLHGPRTFLSSDGSTESLISVLEHDSYQSLPASDDEQPPQPDKTAKDQKLEDKPAEKAKGKPKMQRKIHRSRSSDTFTKSEEVTTSTTSRPTSAASGRTTPWEDWMIRKAKAMRIQEEKEIQRLKKLKEEKEKEQKEKAEQLKKCEKNVTQWNERKGVELKTRKKMDNQRLNAEKELEEAKKKEIEQKAQVKFSEWQNQKKNEENDRKKQDKLKKQKEDKEKEERTRKCEEKYKAWLKDAKKRPKSAPHSYGYADGKLTGYYDRCTYPTPSYYNPIPWQPIPVPNPPAVKKTKPKKNTRKRFNPSKYL